MTSRARSAGLQQLEPILPGHSIVTPFAAGERSEPLSSRVRPSAHLICTACPRDNSAACCLADGGTGELPARLADLGSDELIDLFEAVRAVQRIVGPHHGATAFNIAVKVSPLPPPPLPQDATPESMCLGLP